MFVLTERKSSKFLIFQKDKMLKNEVTDYPKEKFEARIKSYLQQYNNRLFRTN